jgi:hypothetical protein
VYSESIMTSYETATAANYLARCGYRIFPIKPAMKGEPLVQAWQAQATGDPAKVASWWPANSRNNIGVVGDGKLILDIDWRKPGCREALAALEGQHGALPPTYTVSTPSGGEHRYYVAPDVPNSAGKLGAGLDIKSKGGYVVGPWSYTTEIPGKQSAGFYIVKDDRAPANSPAWLIELAGADRLATSTPTPPSVTISDLQLADLTSALNHLARVPDIARNDLWSHVGYALLSLGDQGREIWCDWSERAPGYTPGAPEQWWAAHNPKNTRTDFRNVYSIAHRFGWTNPNPAGDPNAVPWAAPPPGVSTAPIAPAGAKRFTPINAWTYADGPDPQWRVEGLLPQQGLVMIFGASGAGKSFFALDLVMAIERGGLYGNNNRKVTPGRVVYILAEGAGGFRKRLRAYRIHHGLAADSPAPGLVTVAPNLMSDADSGELQAAILEAGGADVIVIDTLHASAAGADENSAKDMGTVLGHCRNLQAATGGLVILIHHSGKDEERGARGSSSLRAAMDTEIEVSGGSGGEFSVAHVTKQRDGDTEGTVFFKLVSVTLPGDKPTTSAAVQHIGRPATARKARASEEQSIAVQEVREFYPDGVHLTKLVAALQGRRPDMRADNLKRSVTRAIDGGLLSIDSSETVRLAKN